MIHNDFWEKPADLNAVDEIDWSFYPGEGYRGNLYSRQEIIGDFTADSIEEIKSVFPWIFED